MFSPMDFHSEMARFRRHMNNIFNDFNRSFPFDAPFADWNQYFLEDFSRPAVEGSSEQKGSLTSEQKQPNTNAGGTTGTNQMTVEPTAQQRSDSSTLRNPASPGASASPSPSASASPSGTALSTTNTQQSSDSEASTSAVRPWRWGGWGWGWGNNSLTPYSSSTSSSSSSFNAISIPRLDIVENSDNFQLNCDLPGISKDNVKVSVTADGRLLIHAERTEQQEQKDENAKYHRMERSYGKFKRSFVLPENVDAEGVKAKHEHGLLQITLPKKPKAEPKPDKQIPIS